MLSRYCMALFLSQICKPRDSSKLTRFSEDSNRFVKGIRWVSRNLVGIIFYTRKVLLTSHYEKRLFEYASQPRVAGSDIRLLSYLWS